MSKTWEDEFDEKFSNLVIAKTINFGVITHYSTSAREDIKSFIRTLLKPEGDGK